MLPPCRCGEHRLKLTEKFTSLAALLPFDKNQSSTPVQNGNPSDQTLRRFGGRQPLCGIGVVSRIELTRIPAWAIARIADSRPPPGPFTRTSTSRIPTSAALRAASPAACSAAKGVPLREPRKPRAPEDECATRLPCVSVTELSAWLNEAEM